jgi:hypothetical protein
MQRREFITLLGGVAAAWPFVGRAQQRDQMRRIGVLMNSAADEPDGQARLTGFLQGLQEFGWSTGRNIRIDYRCSRSHTGRHHGFDKRERGGFAAGKQYRAHRIRGGH